jgi:hypothetical protein
MKTFGCFRWLATAAVAALLPVAAQAVPGHVMGGFVGRGSHHNMGGSVRDGRPVSMGQKFGHGRFADHGFVDHDRFFFRHHHNRFIFIFDFAAFGFPWWYPDYYYSYPYYYPYYGPVHEPQYWTNLALSVQSALAHRGYYHGAVEGEIGSGSGEAIRAFQAAQGLPVTGMIDPKLLKALGIKYKTA